jgi:hypothetical protein
MRDRDAWGEPLPQWAGDALTDLHSGSGTPWRKTAVEGVTRRFRSE